MKPGFTFFTAAALFATLAMATPRRPWRFRKNPAVETYHITAHRNTPPNLWPQEPASPVEVTPQQFQNALGHLCDQTGPARIERYAHWILASSNTHHIDPFLLAALVYDQSNCRPIPYKRYRKQGQLGPTHLPFAMHQSAIRKGQYTYYTLDGDTFVPHHLNFEGPINRSLLGRAQTNIEAAAAILEMFKIQAPMLNRLFAQPPFRHYISHWFYGDWVKTVEPENRVLTARRRLLQYYKGNPGSPVGQANGISLYSPLDGIPRLVIDYFGNKRGHKTGYGHRGIDLDGAVGEPVRAVADGRVTFAGMDLPGSGKNKRLTPTELADLGLSDIPQGGGLYVSILHDNHLTSMYMHLSSFAVAYNQRVKAGQVIGTVGQSGAIKSGPHLHFELLDGEHRINPAVALEKMLVNPYIGADRKKRRPTFTPITQKNDRSPTVLTLPATNQKTIEIDKDRR